MKYGAGKRSRVLFVVVGICVIAAVVAVVSRLCLDKSDDYLETFREEIRNSPCIKMEYSGDEESVLVESDTLLLSSYFMGLDLVESDEEVTQWTYRITFNSKPVGQGDEEIVVLVGENSMSIDGHCYTTSANGGSIAGVREYLGEKYSYYRSLYFQDARRRKYSNFYVCDA